MRALRPTRQDLQQALQAHGLQLRGGWVPDAQDGLAPLAPQRPVAVVWMVGVVGSGFWPHFAASPFYQDGQPDPLDRWSAAIGEALAARYGGRALFPFEGPPYHPFQRWADRSEPTQPSPLLLRLHPQHGLWHAYRFALALPALDAQDAAALQAAGRRPALPHGAASLCSQCAGQPCLQACPVEAFDGSAYALDRCATQLHQQPAGDCMQGGCLARRACPVGADQRYTPVHAAFHMQAFANTHGSAQDSGKRGRSAV